MNLALHGFLLQVILSILDLQHGFRLCSAGEPGYLDFDNLPETNFSCQGKVIGGYYADVEAGCQMFHVCTIGQKDEIMDIKFLCLNGTVFDQETRVCERVDEVDCSKSERFYNLNLELYGNNAVTLSLHENESAEGEQVPDLEDHQTTSARPSTTTTTPRPISSTTAASGPFQHPSGYPQHYQPQPPFPSIQTSQSKSHYDDKNGGYHRQYIYHIPEQNDPSHATSNDRATSFQLFSSQGGASSTTGAPPQVHQIHYSSTPNPPASVSTIYHGTSTIQTLLGGVINPIFHNIASTTDFPHSQTPRESPEYDDDDDADLDDEDEDNHRRYLEPIQSTSQGKISKLSISPVPSDERKSQKDAANFLNIPPSGETSVKSFYPTPKASSKASHVTQHIHILPPYAIPQLKPHQVTINLPPPDIQRIVQNPSPLLPSQSRVIITAKASVSDESGRPLNTTQLVTLPQPTVPTSYDEYKEGDESFDPFYRDVPKIRNARALPGTYGLRRKRSLSALEADEPSETGDTVEYTTQGSDNVEDLTLPGFREDIDSGEVTSTSVEDVDTSQDDEEPIKEVGTTQEPLDDAEISDEREENISATDSQAKSEELHDDYEEYINSNEYSEVADAPATENDSQIAGVTEITAGKNDSLQINFTTDSTPETATISMGNSSGVLVFTDEIPTSESQETMENIENKPVADPLPLDYVDDNYEPNNYQAQEHLEAPADKKAISKSEFMNYQVPIDRANVSNSIPKAILTTAPDTTTFSILTSTETSTPITVLTSQVTSEAPMTTLTAATIIPTASETTSTDTPTSTEPKTTLPTVEATTEADIESTMGDISTETTLSPTTTTKALTKRRRPLKPTLGNIIRAFSTKKSHIYIPPTTTPVPVIIKSRRPLKANRLKSNKFYNDSPPKPAIKRRQFSLRKSTSTEASWPEVEEDFTSQKNAELTETTVETKEIQDGTTPLSVETFVEKMPKEVEAVTEGVTVLGESLTTTKKIEDVFTVTPETLQTTTEVVDVVTSIDAAMLTSVRPVNRKPALQKPASAFNCLEVELYRFYGDKRDCRLFHYCSPGFTSRQILDFRFVCEEGTIFDEDSQNCVHQVENPKCKNRNW